MLCLSHFNSIKVRLERNEKIAKIYLYLFQFHKGAIRTKMNFPALIDYLNFNSIKVRLERTTARNPEKARRNFNSIKVRLEQ